MYVQPLNYFICPQTTSDGEAHPSLKSLKEDFNRVEFIFLFYTVKRLRVTQRELHYIGTVYTGIYI
jgi:hypothetical protein